MAVAQNGGTTDPAMCSSAREYALERLKEREKPATPKGLAGEYGCSQGHMRHAMADLADEGKAERVARGKYVAPPANGGDGAEGQREAPETSGGSDAASTSEASENGMSQHAEAHATDGGPDLSDEDLVEQPEAAAEQWATGADDAGDVEDQEESVDAAGAGGGPDGEPDAAGGADDGAGGGGIPVEVLYVAGAVAVALLVLTVWDRGGDSDEQDDEQDAESADSSGVGLIEGA